VDDDDEDEDVDMMGKIERQESDQPGRVAMDY
jgi:hypothetical protein